MRGTAVSGFGQLDGFLGIHFFVRLLDTPLKIPAHIETPRKHGNSHETQYGANADENGA
jgi:hypothetical protein